MPEPSSIALGGIALVGLLAAAGVPYVGHLFDHPLTYAKKGHDTLRRRMEAAGQGARLVQTYFDSREHSYLGDAAYPPLFEALLNWVEKGQKPTPAGIAQRCRGFR